MKIKKTDYRTLYKRPENKIKTGGFPSKSQVQTKENELGEQNKDLIIDCDIAS